MRITNNIIGRDQLARIQAGLRQVDEAQRRVGSGLRIQKASDDPTAAAQSMQARGSLRALEQYRRNVGAATSRAAAEEGVLDRLTETLVRAKELGLSQGTDTAGDTTRANTRAEVEQLFRFAVGLANTQFDDGYLFGGFRSQTRPYDVTDAGTHLDFATASPVGEHVVEISAGQTLPANHDGTEVFEATGALAALRDLGRALGAGDTPGIRTAVASLDTALGGVQGLVGDVGARMNALQVTSANLDALDTNLTTFRSDLEEVDLEKAVTELVSRQSAIQAAMLATSRVMGMNLTEYLR
ncbi:MAG TPA: flagellar hook-associated protein FlgL [Longimicrobiaceae bacterium]